VVDGLAKAVVTPKALEAPGSTRSAGWHGTLLCVLRCPESSRRCLRPRLVRAQAHRGEASQASRWTGAQVHMYTRPQVRRCTGAQVHWCVVHWGGCWFRGRDQQVVVVLITLESPCSTRSRGRVQQADAVQLWRQQGTATSEAAGSTADETVSVATRQGTAASEAASTMSVAASAAGSTPISVAACCCNYCLRGAGGEGQMVVLPAARAGLKRVHA
jgi:hypothetical protein